MKIYRLKRKKIILNNNLFRKFIANIQMNDAEQVVATSIVWKNMFSKYKLQKKIAQISSTEILKHYSSYYLNGLSDGACAGFELSKFSTKLKYLIREPIRIREVNKILNKKFSNNLLLTNPPLSSNAYSGCIWMFKIRNFNIPIEISDHIYFLLKVYDELKKSAISGKTFLFIGDGSALLSNLILNIFPVKKAVFVDLPHFLIRQYIVNVDFNTICEFYTPSQVKKIPYDCYAVVNQDSFPEIPTNQLKNYLSNNILKINSKIFSYNQKPLDKYHSNWTKLLKKKDWKLDYHERSYMRKKYYLEIYSKLK